MLTIFILTCYYQYGVSAELPTGKQKEPPVKFNKAALEAPAPKEPKEKVEVEVAGPTGQAPASNMFQPKNNVTYNTSSVGNRPSGPPPAPQQKPTQPVPMPPR